MKSDSGLLVCMLISVFVLMPAFSACKTKVETEPDSEANTETEYGSITGTETEAIFNKIEKDMTVEQVNDIIGFPGQRTEVDGEYDWLDIPNSTYIWVNSLMSIEVIFQDGRVLVSGLFDGEDFITSNSWL